mgnify:CR=1 FL=1
MGVFFIAKIGRPINELWLRIPLRFDLFTKRRLIHFIFQLSSKPNSLRLNISAWPDALPHKRSTWSVLYGENTCLGAFTADPERPFAFILLSTRTGAESQAPAKFGLTTYINTEIQIRTFGRYNHGANTQAHEIDKKQP